MRDEDFNSLFGSQPKPSFWVALAVLIISAILGLSLIGCQEVEATHAFDPLESLAFIDTPKANGSGFFISPTRVVTAKHVVDGNEVSTLTIYDNRGSAYKVRWVERIAHTDAAIITLNTASPVIPAVVSCKTPSRLDVVTVAGAPLGMRDMVAHQTVIGFNDAADGTRITTTGLLVAGMSGGPAFNADNQAIGIMVEEVVYAIGKDQMGMDIKVVAEINGIVPLYDIPQLCEAPSV